MFDVFQRNGQRQSLDKKACRLNIDGALQFRIMNKNQRKRREKTEFFVIRIWGYLVHTLVHGGGFEMI